MAHGTSGAYRVLQRGRDVERPRGELAAGHLSGLYRAPSVGAVHRADE